jgi:hypothetical protein
MAQRNNLLKIVNMISESRIDSVSVNFAGQLASLRLKDFLLFSNAGLCKPNTVVVRSFVGVSKIFS